MGVGAASVDFQVSTGRMPLAGPNVQAPRIDTVKFTEEQIAAMAAYVASLAPGPAIPDAKLTSGEGGDVALGGEIYRVNCAMCHNFAGSGGALTRGKYAPSLYGVDGKYVYEAMITGPQSMPVFNDTNLNPEAKASVRACCCGMNARKSHALPSPWRTHCRMRALSCSPAAVYLPTKSPCCAQGPQVSMP